MKARAGAAGLILAALLLRSSTAAADDTAAAVDPAPDDRAPFALLAGGGITFLSTAVGATFFAQARDRDTKNQGILAAQGVTILSPIVSHAIMGETTRGLYFAIPLAVAEAGSMTLFASLPGVLKHAPPGQQYWLATTLSISIFGSAIGAVDALFAGNRAAAKAHAASSSSSLSFAPLFGGGTTGAMLFGSL